MTEEKYWELKDRIEVEDYDERTEKRSVVEEGTEKTRQESLSEKNGKQEAGDSGKGDESPREEK